jgi:hypothetical protein
VFNLVIAALSIVLVLSLAASGLYYGSAVWVEYFDKVDYAKYKSEAGQIVGAMEFYKTRVGMYPPGNLNSILTTLIADGYLKNAPESTWNMNSSMYIRTVIDGVESCAAINGLSGMDISQPNPTDGCPVCSDANYDNWPACREN